jgi:hypothetical protein
VERHGSDAQRSESLQIWMMRRLREDRYLVGPETVEVAVESARLAARRADPGFRAFKRFNLAFCRLWARDIHAALDDFAAAIVDGERAGDVVVLSRCHTYAAVAHRFLLDDDGCARSTDAAHAAASSGKMVEYLAAVEGNRAWLARRRGDGAVARRHAAAAIEQWQRTPLVFGFQWIARLPLLVVAHAEGDQSTVEQQLEVLVSPSQQRFPAEVEGPLLAGDLDETIHRALALGYA